MKILKMKLIDVKQIFMIMLKDFLRKRKVLFSKIILKNLEIFQLKVTLKEKKKKIFKKVKN